MYLVSDRAANILLRQVLDADLSLSIYIQARCFSGSQVTWSHLTETFTDTSRILDYNSVGTYLQRSYAKHQAM